MTIRRELIDELLKAYETPLAMRNLAKKWSRPIRDWKPALNRFAIEFEGRFPR